MARYGLFVLKVPLNPNQPSRHAWESSSSSSSKNWFTWRIYHWAICVMHPLCKILSRPVMSTAYSQTKWRNVGWKTSTFLFNVYKRFFYFCHVFLCFLTFFYFFLERFFYIYTLLILSDVHDLHSQEGCAIYRWNRSSSETSWRCRS